MLRARHTRLMVSQVLNNFCSLYGYPPLGDHQMFTKCICCESEFSNLIETSDEAHSGQGPVTRVVEEILSSRVSCQRIAGPGERRGYTCFKNPQCRKYQGLAQSPAKEGFLHFTNSLNLALPTLTRIPVS